MTSNRFEIRTYEAPICDGGGTRYAVYDTQAGEIAHESAAYLMTHDRDCAQAWLEQLTGTQLSAPAKTALTEASTLPDGALALAASHELDTVALIELRAHGLIEHTPGVDQYWLTPKGAAGRELLGLLSA